jgi:hypothetical protein
VNLEGDADCPAKRGMQRALIGSDRRYDLDGDIRVARAAAGRLGDGLRDRNRREGDRELTGECPRICVGMTERKRHAFKPREESD